MGAGAVILPNVTIGRFARVGAGAVATRDVPDCGLVVGNRPAGRTCGPMRPPTPTPGSERLKDGDGVRCLQ
ncbi:MAG: hypothetical protein J7452_08590 [Thermoflexus sp.]|nr:hypothetical protein [Thermoflexus sp.]